MEILQTDGQTLDTILKYNNKEKTMKSRFGVSPFNVL
jgi:hypothetical protein